MARVQSNGINSSITRHWDYSVTQTMTVHRVNSDVRVRYQYKLSFGNFTNKVIIFINSIDICFSLSLSLNLFYNFKDSLEGRYLLVVVEYPNYSCMISLKIYNMIAMDNLIMPEYSIIIIHKICLCFILQIGTCFLEGPITAVRHAFWTNRIKLWYLQQIQVSKGCLRCNCWMQPCFLE